MIPRFVHWAKVSLAASSGGDACSWESIKKTAMPITSPLERTDKADQHLPPDQPRAPLTSDVLSKVDPLDDAKLLVACVEDLMKAVSYLEWFLKRTVLTA